MNPPFQGPPFLQFQASNGVIFAFILFLFRDLSPLPSPAKYPVQGWRGSIHQSKAVLAACFQGIALQNGFLPKKSRPRGRLSIFD